MNHYLGQRVVVKTVCNEKVIRGKVIGCSEEEIVVGSIDPITIAITSIYAIAFDTPEGLEFVMSVSDQVDEP